jgi:hypothetical protein
MGATLENTSYSELYQLYSRVEEVAFRLEKRRRQGRVPSKPFIAELYDIATELKVLDRKLVNPESMRKR